MIKDLIERTPRPNDLYEGVKERLITIYGSSAETHLSQLIQGEVSRLRKPSLILNRLRALDIGCGDAIVCTVFLKRLPAPYRVMLSVPESTDLRELAAMADKYMEAVAACEPGNVAACSITDTGSQDLKAAIDRLITRVENFETQIKNNRGSHIGTCARRRSRLSFCNKRSSDSKELCCLHKKYGVKARNCYKPCAWINNRAGN